MTPPAGSRHRTVSKYFEVVRELFVLTLDTATAYRYFPAPLGGSGMSKVINVMKSHTTSSCVGLIQAFPAWTGRDIAIIGTEGKCQEIQD